MKKLLILAALVALVIPASAQKRSVDAHWCALGTSITWYNENVASALGGFTKGYQTRVMEKIAFTQYSNRAVNGGALKTVLANNMLVKADYYTIEHGINDWGQSIPVGTMDDYINNTNNGTFAAEYRKVIDAIYKLNPKAKIVICTPRKGAGFNNYLPANCNDAKNGIYLKEYADMARKIAEYESVPVADFFSTCGGYRNIYSLSLQDARASEGITSDGVHPNDPGYQLMANVLIDALERVIVD